MITRTQEVGIAILASIMLLLIPAQIYTFELVLDGIRDAETDAREVLIEGITNSPATKDSITWIGN